MSGPVREILLLSAPRQSNPLAIGKESAVLRAAMSLGCAHVVVASLICCGCQKNPHPNPVSQANTAGAAGALGTVAVIDLDAVARQIGRSEIMVASIKQREATLNQQLRGVQTSYQQQLRKKQEEFGDEATGDASQQLALLQRQVHHNLNQCRTQAQTDLNRHRLQLIAQFREEVKPLARQVAAEKGLSIVVTKNDAVVFTYTSAVDITDEVATRLIAQTPQNVSPPSEEVAQQPSAGDAQR
jgi:Skp family chaperone for outer membrane proteins